MALFQSRQVIAQKAVPTGVASNELVVITGDFVVPAGLANGDVIEMVGLPAYHIPIGCKVFFPQVDSNGSPTATATASILNGRYGDGATQSRALVASTQFFTASTTIRAGGQQVDTTNLATSVFAPSTSDRGVGITIAAAIATLATGGTIRFVLLCQSVPPAVAIV